MGVIRFFQRLLCGGGTPFRIASDLAYYKQMARTLPQMIWTAKPNGQHDFFNDRWFEYTGLPLAQLQKDWRSIEVHPDDLPRCLEKWDNSLKTGQPYENEIRIRRRDGAYLWHIVRANPLVDDDGKVFLWMGSATDIDERKRAEEVLLKESERRRFFMNALSHDLRTPLHSIVLNAQLASLGVQSGDTGTATEAISVIKENATAATAMLNSLLEFARFSANDKNLMELCNLSDILIPILRRFDKAAELKGVTLKGPERISTIKITTDRAKIDRILSNLVDNALKFTTKGFVAMETKIEGEDLTIFVSDTGLGISAEHQSLLFGEFFQAGNYARDRQKGFGMGLAISRVLARQLGGDVQLVKSSSEGSRFAVTLRGCAETTPDPAVCVGS